jgi:hypothetical protein
MTQKPKLSVGDRVRWYQSGTFGTGTIDEIGGVLVRVVEDTPREGDKPTRYWYHAKQCRKLRPKQKPEKEREPIPSGVFVFLHSAIADSQLIDCNTRINYVKAALNELERYRDGKDKA